MTTLADALIGAGVAALDSRVGMAPEDEVRHRVVAVEDNLRLFASIAGEFDFPDDPCEVAFGVPYTDLIDSEGVFSPARLLAAYYGRYGELEHRLNTVLAFVTRVPLPVLDALAPAEALILVPRPLVALRTALRTRDLILQKLDSDLERVAIPLRDLKLGVDRSEASPWSSCAG